MTDKANILIIDDEEALRESMKAVLENAGYSVQCAENSLSALAFLQKQYFDILLVDYMLPDMNGVDCIKEASKISEGSVPVIVSGASSIEIAVEAMRIGAHDYLLKPINMDDLLKVLADILNEREGLRKGKSNIEQAIQKLNGKEEPDTVTIVSSGDRISGNKGKWNIINSVGQIVKDVFDIFRKH